MTTIDQDNAAAAEELIKLYADESVVAKSSKAAA